MSLSILFFQRGFKNQTISNAIHWGIFFAFSLLSLSCSNGLSDSNGNSSIRVPQNLLVNAGARKVELLWQGVPGATSYTVY